MFDAVKQLKQSRAKRAELLTQSERLLATAVHESRSLTDDEKRQDDGLHAAAMSLDEDITRLERLMAADRRITLPDDEAPVAQAGGDLKCGFRDIADFARAVHKAVGPSRAMDARLAAMFAAPSNYMSEGGSAGEAYLVPPDFRQEIWSLVFAGTGDVLDLVAPEPTLSNSVAIGTDETTPWGSTGVQAAWRSEVSAMSATKAVTKEVQVKLHELYALVQAGDELLEDAPRLANRLTVKAAEAIRYKAADAIVNGDGVGKPLGWTVAGCAVSQAKETNQTATTINAANVAKMYGRLIPSGSTRIGWLIAPDAYNQLPQMTIGNYPVFVPPVGGFKEAPDGFLFGRPVRKSMHCATLGTVNDIQLFDAAGYYAATKSSGIKFDSSIHLFFDYNLTAFRWVFRLGGQPFLSAAVSPARGSSTMSHFVTLATRS